VRGVEHVDVDRNVQPSILDSAPNPLDHPAQSMLLDVHRRDHLESEHCIIRQILAAENRPAYSDMNASIEPKQAFLRSPPKRGSMVVRHAEVSFPSVKMSVEMKHSHGAETTPRCSQQR